MYIFDKVLKQLPNTVVKDSDYCLVNHQRKKIGISLDVLFYPLKIFNNLPTCY